MHVITKMTLVQPTLDQYPALNSQTHKTELQKRVCVSVDFCKMYSVVLSLLLLALSRTTTAATSAADLDAEGYLPPSNRVDEDDASRNVRGRRLQPCLNSWDVRTPDGCNFDALVSIMNSQLPPPPCGHSMEEELMAIFGLTLTQTRVAVDEMCLQAMADKELREGVTFGEILMQDNDVYPKAYFDGE